VSDHNVPTTDRSHGIADPVSRLQVETLDANCDRTGITQFKMNDKRQGIVHIIGPEQGATLPGMTVVCGDSHTSTNGASGAVAHRTSCWPSTARSARPGAPATPSNSPARPFARSAWKGA